MKAARTMMGCIRIFMLVITLRYLDVTYSIDFKAQMLVGALAFIWGISEVIEGEMRHDKEE